MRLYDYGLSTLEQYGLAAKMSSRVRGALACQTEEGLLLLKEFNGSEKKLLKQQELLLHIQELGHAVDSFLPNKEGNLISRDKDNIPYTLQHWYEGKECDTKSKEDIMKSVRVLAKLHKAMRLPLVEDYLEKSLVDEYRRHNQEIRKIRKFIRKKGASCTFEKVFLSSVEWFLRKGEDALGMLEASSYDKLREEVRQMGWICHGEYNQHNILLSKGKVAVTNFGKWGYDIQIADLYRFMRKILEKYNWDPTLGKEMIFAYHSERQVSPDEWKNLQIRFLYPEKFWKLANYYFSHNKAWIPEKNTEKLNTLIAQKILWSRFADECFRIYPF